MDVQILATGSSGNCVLVDHQFLIDAGITTKLFTNYGFIPEQLSGLMITHRHSDHMKLPFVRFLLKAGVKTWMPKDAVAELAKENRIEVQPLVESGQIIITNPDTAYEIGGTVFEAYPQSHHDIVNYAFVFTKGNTRLLYSTDLDTVEPSEKGVGLLHLGNFDTILLEGNYDESYLRRYIEYMISLVPDADNPANFDDNELERWVKIHYRSLPDEIARNAFRAIQNRRHLSKQQARAYAMSHLKENGTYYEIHRSSQFYEEPEGWMEE